jgi:hypothetical protein
VVVSTYTEKFNGSAFALFFSSVGKKHVEVMRMRQDGFTHLEHIVAGGIQINEVQDQARERFGRAKRG